MSQTIKDHYDVVIIGGGINGVGIARELALRHISCLLIEKNTIASGTSSASSKLAHGGLRYLEQGHLKLVFDSCHEREILLENAPHLVKPLPFLIPIYPHSKNSKWQLKIGLWLYDLLSGNKKRPHQFLTPNQLKILEPTLPQKNLIGAYLYYDAQMDDAKLCKETGKQAVSFGANIIENTEIIGHKKEQNKITHLTLSTNPTQEIKTKAIINASGPWSDQVSQLFYPDSPVELRPSKGIHIVTKKITNQHAILLRTKKDNRVFFVIPWKGQSLIGTTDTDFQGDPDHVQATKEDIQYLLDATNDHFPDIHLTKEDIINTFAGLRPLLRSKTGTPSSISRDHKCIKHHNFFSIIGGKYTTFRLISEQIAKEVIHYLKPNDIFKSISKNLKYDT